MFCGVSTVPCILEYNIFSTTAYFRPPKKALYTDFAAVGVSLISAGIALLGSGFLQQAQMPVYIVFSPQTIEIGMNSLTLISSAEMSDD